MYMQCNETEIPEAAILTKLALLTMYEMIDHLGVYKPLADPLIPV